MPDDPAEAIIGLYARHAEAWARDRGDRLIEGAWFDRFHDLLPERGSVLDLGCGSGMPIAGHLIGHGHRITGVDTAPGLLALCRARFPDKVWIGADMRGLVLGRQFDGVLAWDSLFHLRHDDQRAMFTVIGSHAAPDAVLMFTSGPAHGVALGSYGGETLFHASLDPAEYRALLAAQGFTVAGHVAEDPDCGGRTVWLARRD
ncbi:MAG: class I SAM-dependent methyltransferase [Acetobacteraceae bacterium]|nr:class I SAM-dependent methyltransferase [Acetobacteraceae bacterium]